MRTLLRRILLIFIILVIAFFLYSAIDPHGSSRLISWIKGETGTIIVSSGNVINTIDLTDGQTGDNIITISPVSGSTQSPSSQERTRAQRRSGNPVSGSVVDTGVVARTGSTGLTTDFLNAVSAPTSTTGGVTLSGVTMVNSGVVSTGGVVGSGTASPIGSNSAVTSTTTTTTRTIVTTTTQVVVLPDQTGMVLSGSEQQVTDQFFGNLVDGVVKP